MKVSKHKGLAKISPSRSKLVDRPKFRSDVEGLRAIAILLVIAYHAGIPGFEGGYIGVDMFFVLSGYLITWLLVHEIEETGTINLLHFYSRRARRLLPALALVLVVTVIITTVLYAPFEQLDITKTALATAAYLSNVYFAEAAVDYLGAASETNPFLHTWSLSVEEQFYFVWPLFMIVASGALHRWQRSISRLRLLSFIAVLTTVSLLASLYLTEARQSWAFFLSPARAWEFSIGALGILIPAERWHLNQENTSKIPRSLRLYVSNITEAQNEVLAFLGLSGVLVSTIFFDESTLFPGFAALLPALSTVMILRACAAGSTIWIARFLRLRWFQEVGRVSYSWYLWHWPLLVFAGVISESLSLVARVGVVVLSLALAEASYRWLENPVRHAPFLARKPVRSIAMGVAITVFSISLSLGWVRAATAWSLSPEQIPYTSARESVPVIYANGCHADFLTTEIKLKECTVGAKNSRSTVVLLGDSHAAQWYPPLAKLALTERWRLTSMTKSSCPYVDASSFSQKLSRQYTECDTWRNNAFKMMRDLDPDLVIVTSFSSEQFVNRDWLEGSERTLKLLGKTSKNVVVLRDPPNPKFDVPACLARRKWGLHRFFKSACNIPKEDVAAQQAYSSQKSSAERYQNVSVVDMNPYICGANSCNLERKGIVLYRDNHHLTSEFSLTLAKDLQSQLSAVLQ